MSLSLPNDYPYYWSLIVIELGACYKGRKWPGLNAGKPLPVSPNPPSQKKKTLLLLLHRIHWFRRGGGVFHLSEGIIELNPPCPVFKEPSKVQGGLKNNVLAVALTVFPTQSSFLASLSLVGNGRTAECW